MASVKQPRSLAQAAALASRFAELEGQIEAIETNRNDCIAEVNARCDRAAHDLIAERDLIAEKMAPWWEKAGTELVDGVKKSIELGGCIVGTRKGRRSLQIDGKPGEIAKRMFKLPWARKFVRVGLSPDKASIAKAIDGPKKDELAALGFSMKPGEETFYIERAEQGRTLSGQGK